MYLSSNFQNRFLIETQVLRRGRKGVRAGLMPLNRHFMEQGQPHALADFNPTMAGFKSHKMTMNLGSVRVLYMQISS